MDFTLVFILIISIFGFIAFRFFTRRKKTVVKDQTNRVELGFLPIPFPEADFKQSINQLHHKYSGQQIAVTDVFQKVVDQDYVYLFDVEDQAEKEPFVLARDMVAIRSLKLTLPRMTIMTRFKAMGGFGNVMDRFVSRHSNWDFNLQGLIQLDYESNPIISQRYLVFSPAAAEESTRQFLTDTRLSFLASLENNYVIDTLGDIFTIINASSSKELSRKAQIERSVQDAISLANLFQNEAALPPPS